MVDPAYFASLGVLVDTSKSAVVDENGQLQGIEDASSAAAQASTPFVPRTAASAAAASAGPWTSPRVPLSPAPVLVLHASTGPSPSPRAAGLGSAKGAVAAAAAAAAAGLPPPPSSLPPPLPPLAKVVKLRRGAGAGGAKQ
jgi:hypothetical protein